MTTESSERDPLIGQLVSSRYRIKRKIGEGGMGTVYECLHEAIEKKIALKVLHAEYSSSPEVVHRFKQEAISASRMKHQNVIDVFDFGQLDDGSCFIAMEFLEGMDLGQALEKKGRFSPDKAIRITTQICRALGLGHGRGVIHRDMKPENVFLQMTEEGDEVVKIVDFGIAQLRSTDEPVESAAPTARPRRLTKTGMIFGTPEYMAPEQARGREIDQRSDVYSTGVILYELLTGAVPFLGESFLEVLNQHVQSAVPPIGSVNPDVTLSEDLQRAVHKALEKDPDDRYPTMQAFSKRLLSTPEGRSVRNVISSISSEEEEEEADRAYRLENSRIPKPNSSDGTAMFGSPGTPARTEEEPVIPTHSSKAGVFLLALLGLGAAGVGAYFLLSGDDSAKAKEEPPSPIPSASAPSPAPEPAPAPAPAPEPVPAPAPKQITLRVVTDPAGAIVKKDGFQVCSATPCEVLVEPGAAVTLTSEKGTARGEAKVLAQADQEVAIPLVVPRVASPRPRPAPAPSSQLCEVMVDGIKILRPCQ